LSLAAPPPQGSIFPLLFGPLRFFPPRSTKSWLLGLVSFSNFCSSLCLLPRFCEKFVIFAFFSHERPDFNFPPSSLTGRKDFCRRSSYVCAMHLFEDEFRFPFHRVIFPSYGCSLRASECPYLIFGQFVDRSVD